MDNLKLTPFSIKEREQEYTTHTFYERDIQFTLLRLKHQVKPQSGNLYKFGLSTKMNDAIGYNGNLGKKYYFWFFNNKAVVKGRIEALSTFKALQEYCKTKELGKPFAFKVIK